MTRPKESVSWSSVDQCDHGEDRVGPVAPLDEAAVLNWHHRRGHRDAGYGSRLAQFEVRGSMTVAQYRPQARGVTLLEGGVDRVARKSRPR